MSFLAVVALPSRNSGLMSVSSSKVLASVRLFVNRSAMLTLVATETTLRFFSATRSCSHRNLVWICLAFHRPLLATRPLAALLSLSTWSFRLIPQSSSIALTAKLVAEALSIASIRTRRCSS